MIALRVDADLDIETQQTQYIGQRLPVGGALLIGTQLSRGHVTPGGAATIDVANREH